MKNKKLLSEKSIKRLTIVSFSVFLIFIVLGLLGWRWLYNQPESDGIQKSIRTVLNMDDKLSEKVFSTSTLSKKYSKADAVKKPRVNGDAGMSDTFDPVTWRLKVIQSPGDTLFLSLNDIKKLPKTEVIFDFKCIEGWSQVTHWGGVRFSDFVNAYKLRGKVAQHYVGLQTPDQGYYVGIDMMSMIQDQTILCYEMNGKPLPMNQGYPLRLIIPVKYGVKHLKRIGTMFFQDEKPRDFWAERGYDYYSGL